MSDEFRTFGHYPIKNELINEYASLTMTELLERYRESVTVYVDTDGVLNIDPVDGGRQDAENIPLFLSCILGFPQTEDVDWALKGTETWVKETLGADIENIDHRSRTHRHKTVLGLYTEKPSFDQRRRST